MLSRACVPPSQHVVLTWFPAAQKLSLYGKSLFQVHMATTDIDIPDSFMLAIDVNGIEIRDKDSGYVVRAAHVCSRTAPLHLRFLLPPPNRDLLRHFAYPDLGPVTYDAGSTVINFHERMQRRPLHIKTPLVHLISFPHFALRRR